jgi:hypothetical protein
MKIFLLVSPSPLTGEGCLPAGRQGVRVALRLAQGACMVSLSNHPPPLYPVRYGFLFSPVI